MDEEKSNRKIKISFITIIIIAICLCVTTYAYVLSQIKVEDNYFQTGEVKINLNDGKEVISEDEYLFEPGVTVEKEFFIKNESSYSVYYKIYFSDVKGGLATILEITILDEQDDIVYQGTASELTKDKVDALDDTLEVNETRNFKIIFHYPKDKGNETMNQQLSFRLEALATQTKNNPDKEFE